MDWKKHQINTMNDIIGNQIHITGIVQGVGFRPFVYRRALEHELKGFILNTSAGVDIVIEGKQIEIDDFLNELYGNAPPLARIDEITIEQCSPTGFISFDIQQSHAIPDAFQPVSPDVSICQDCLNELFDRNDRRYLYPFINCTNCGPRFTIIEDIPYDRPFTTMSGFKMCPECQAEYDDPLDRRFHAQPVACPKCGPHTWVETSSNAKSSTTSISNDRSLAAVLEARSLLNHGKILGIKGLGGFHLACDALNPGAVIELRNRKLRVDKPFAVMILDVETVRDHCYVNENERTLLESVERPIVLLKRRPESTIADSIAPYQSTVGIMLPYTPLHYMLFNELPGEAKPINANKQLSVLVMTSGNISEEPIAINNREARTRLATLADAFLMHDRPIFTRCDDSVVRVFLKPDEPSSKKNVDNATYPLRRSRGYAPFPVHLSWNSPPLTAVGGELKNTFCIARDRYAFLSQHIGDLENYETLNSFEKSVRHYEHLFRIQPEFIAHDLHPDYLATRYAIERSEKEDIPSIGIQHHHAHIAACMAEHELEDEKPVIGVVFDGTGYGTDGAIWGGEFFLSKYSTYQRVAHLQYIPLPGGDTAIRKPARIALAYLWQAGIEWNLDLPSVDALRTEERQVLRSQLEQRINSPNTSSMGRLFDAIASLIGIRQIVNYEAQAAIELEANVEPSEESSYCFELTSSTELMTVDPTQIIHSVIHDIRAGITPAIISTRFHNSVASMVLEVCTRVRTDFGCSRVVLSGGVWQNIVLLSKTYQLLEKSGFQIHIHRQVPSNDGGIALGQAVITARTIT